MNVSYRWPLFRIFPAVDPQLQLDFEFPWFERSYTTALFEFDFHTSFTSTWGYPKDNVCLLLSIKTDLYVKIILSIKND